MGKEKKFIKIFLIFTFIILIIPASLNIYIDPFFNYHKPVPYLVSNCQYDQEYDVYWKIGQVKHSKGDSIWVGSSLSTHFNKEEVDSLFGVDCSTGIIASGRYNIYQKFINLFMKNNDVENIYYEFQPAHLYDDYNWDRIPEYMETDTVLDDSDYIFNKGVLKQSIKTLLSYFKDKMNNKDEESNTVAEENIIDENAGYGIDIVAGKISSNVISGTRDEVTELFNNRKEIACKNIDTYIVPLIENNPDVEFVFFDPPCSYIDPYLYYNSGYLDIYIDYQKTVVSHLLSYGFENVKFYFFQSDAEFCSDISHYMDEGHYNPTGQTLMVQSIAKNNYLVTTDNLDQVFSDFQNNITEFEIPFLKSCFYGENVVELQEKLRQEGYFINEEGFFSQTEQAVKSFQFKNGLETTGIVFEKEKELLGI